MTTNGYCFGFGLRGLVGAVFAAGSMLALTATAQYTWTGSGVNGNWNNTTNWTGGATYPNGPSDTAAFSAAAAKQPTFNIGVQLDTLTVSGSQNWIFGTAATVTNNTSFTYGSTGGSSFAPKLVGPGGVTVTAGALTNSNAGSLYTGDTWVKGGILDVSAAALNTNAASAAGSNVTAVLVGDPATGINAELRLGGGGNRNITVQGGTGTRALRLQGGSSTYTGTNTLNQDTVFEPSVAANTYNLNGMITGTGAVIVAGFGTVSIGGTNNNYTGRTIVNAGRLQVATLVATNTSRLGSPATGNEEVWLGDTSGTNNVIFNPVNNGTWYRPLRVRAGSSGTVTFDGTGNGSTWTFYDPLTLERGILFKNVNNANWTFTSALLGSGSGPSTLTTDLRGDANNTGLFRYLGAANPTHNGGTWIGGIGGMIRWEYPTTAAPGTVLRFGSDTSGNPGLITLDGAHFDLWNVAASHLTLENPFAVTVNNGAIYTDPKSANITNIFIGPIALGGRLTIGGNAGNGSLNSSPARHQGTITIDQSSVGLRGLNCTYWQVPMRLEGRIIDGSGPARNSLILRAGFTCPITNAALTYANGTFIEADNLIDVKIPGSGSLGLGDIWLPDGALLRLGQSFHVASGAKVGMWANPAANSLLVVTNSFVPALLPDAVGVLAADFANFNAITSLAALGSGKMFLGAYGGGTFSGTALAPGADGVYRLGGGGGTLTINNSVLAGAGNTVQVGLPGIATVNGVGNITLLSTNSWGGGSTVNYGSTLRGNAQAIDSPFGSSTAGMTINCGTLRLDGINTPSVTNKIGTMTVNGAATLHLNQTNARTNGLVVAGLSARDQAAPYVVQLNGSGLANLGVKERIVLASSAPVPVNGMVSPLYFYGTAPDYVTYDSGSDSAGPIGFKSAAGSYVAVANATVLAGVGAAGIANVTNALVLTNDVEVYALRINKNLTNDVAARTLTIGSGGLFVSGGCTFYAPVSINFGSSEGIINCSGGAPTINGKLIGTNGLTITGGSTAQFNADNTSCLTGTIAVVRGRVHYNTVSSDLSFGATNNVLYLDGGFLSANNGGTPLARPVVLGPSGGTFSGPTGGNSGGTWSLNGPITGIGMAQLLDSGYSTSLVMTNQNNTYSGGSLVKISATIRPTSSLGVGDVTCANTLNLYGDRNIGGGDYYGNQTTSRQARLAITGSGRVNFYSLAPSVGSLSGSGSIYLTNNCVLTVGGDDTSTIYAGIIAPAYSAVGSVGSLYKTGNGTFTFKGRSTVTGTTTVQQGELVVDGYMAGGITVNSGATLAGAGTVGAVTINNGATFLPGSTATTGISTNRMDGLTASSLTFVGGAGAGVTININGPTNYTQLVANGPVDLGGATLTVNLNYQPDSADVFYILLNKSVSATSGKFAGLTSEPATIDLGNGYSGKISYQAAVDSAQQNDVKIYEVTKGGKGTMIILH